MTNLPSPMRLYFRCPGCALVARPGSASYPAAPDGSPAWDGRPAEVRCSECGHLHWAQAADIVPDTTTSTCPREGCGNEAPCPQEAAVVTCTACHLLYAGPATADPAVRDLARATLGLHTVEMQGTLAEAKRRAGRA
ncbi:hypothetical protein ABTX81_30820 [Kitasatospora sp. NPDC097605]|uniref:hypothetical protein n=1 Tax=Kitasatospora sp. NPDC097605 TaxID=3157226 RepID=UPI00333454E1